jgi:hypothetical protein
MKAAVLPAGAALLVAVLATPVFADSGDFHGAFDSDPAVTLDIRVVHDTRAEIAYPKGVRGPYDAAGTNNVQEWCSTHRPPVRYELDSSRRLAWALVPLDNPAALPGVSALPAQEAARSYSAAGEVAP